MQQIEKITVCSRFVVFQLFISPLFFERGTNGIPTRNFYFPTNLVEY